MGADNEPVLGGSFVYQLFPERFPYLRTIEIILIHLCIPFAALYDSRFHRSIPEPQQSGQQQDL